MPKKGRNEADDAIALAIAQGKTQDEAAKIAGVCAQTVGRRMAQPEFRQRVDQLKAEMIGRGVALLGNTLARAAEELTALLGSDDEKIRLLASKEIIASALKARQVEDLERQVAEMQQRLDAILKKRK